MVYHGHFHVPVTFPISAASVAAPVIFPDEGSRASVAVQAAQDVEKNIWKRLVIDQDFWFGIWGFGIFMDFWPSKMVIDWDFTITNGCLSMVSAWWLSLPPLKSRLSQLGWWHSQYMEKQTSSKPPTRFHMVSPIYVLLVKIEGPVTGIPSIISTCCFFGPVTSPSINQPMAKGHLWFQFL